MNKKGVIYFAIIVVIIAIAAVLMLNKDISKNKMKVQEA